MRALLNRVLNRLLTPITVDNAEKREPNMNELLLKGARLSGQLEAGLLKASLTQRYINPGDADLEVVYTFPLPFYATITEVFATIGDKQLKGVVKANKEAERDYEKAISQGDSAVLIEVTGDGLYTANLGNLRPGEQLTVSMHFVQIIDWYQDQARLMFPTTIAPRYGDAQRQGGLPFHADTGTSLTVEHGFTLDLVLRGAMASAVIESPSHAIKQIVENDEDLRIQFADEAFLDRDFVLRLEGLKTPQGEVLVQAGEDAYFALATFYPPIPADAVPGTLIRPIPSSEAEPSTPWAHPLRAKLLVDCSGSMQGDSMESARQGIRALFDSLSSRDQIAVARFGSSLEHVIAKPQSADPKTRVVLRRWLAGLQADLGGTELESALEGVFKSTMQQEPFDVLLITDGEVWDISAIVKRAKDSGHRIFAIGVGSSPGESLLRQLAEETGGAALFVTPREDMAQAVHRLAAMMSGPRVREVSVSWQGQPALSSFVSANLYAGVPFRAVAQFAPADLTTIDAVATLSYSIGSDQHMLSSAKASQTKDLAVRYVAAHACLKQLPDEAQAAFAEKHQLLTKDTAWILVHVRKDGDKAGTLPELAQVPSMHAAGSHGAGTLQVLKQAVLNDIEFYDDEASSVSFQAMSCSAAHVTESLSVAGSLDNPTVFRAARAGPRDQQILYRDPSSASSAAIDKLIKDTGAKSIEIPAFLRRADTQQPAKVEADSVDTGEEEKLRNLLSEVLARLNQEADFESLWDWVQAIKLPGLLSDQLNDLKKSHRLSKAQVLALMILCLADDAVEPQPNRQQMRLINRTLDTLSEQDLETFKGLIFDAMEMDATEKGPENR